MIIGMHLKFECGVPTGYYCVLNVHPQEFVSDVCPSVCGFYAPTSQNLLQHFRGVHELSIESLDLRGTSFGFVYVMPEPHLDEQTCAQCGKVLP